MLKKFQLTAGQKQELVLFMSGWMEKLSVGSLLVGLFRPEHFLGGMIIGAVSFVVALVLKIRSVK